MTTVNNFIDKISNEQTALLPAVEFRGEIRIVEHERDIAAACKTLAEQPVIGFDTETRPSFRKGQIHKVALMQISTADRCFLFRLNKIGICAELKEFLENPDILKIGLSVHDDFNVLRRSGEINRQGFVELQNMVHRYDITDISLQKIYAIIFGERISKSQRLTNWEAAELSPAQQAYAALDAWACLKIYNYLKDGRFDPLSSPYRRRPEPKPAARPLT